MGPEGALAISLRIIERTTALIERGWCQDCLAIDASGKDGQLSNALRFSLYGAWLRACHEAESNVNVRQMYLGASIVAQDAIDLAVRETDPDKNGHAGMLGIDKYNRLVKWNNAADRSKDEVLSVLHTASRNLVGDLEAVKGDEGALIVQALSRLGAAGTKQEGKLRRSTVVRPSPSKRLSVAYET